MFFIKIIIIDATWVSSVETVSISGLKYRLSPKGSPKRAKNLFKIKVN